MMGRLNHDQRQFFYSFRLEEAVPGDHPVRGIAAVLETIAPLICRTDLANLAKCGIALNRFAIMARCGSS
jgi:hypothetical protein